MAGAVCCGAGDEGAGVAAGEAGRAIGTAAPQLGQNSTFSGISAPQFLQNMFYPPERSERRAGRRSRSYTLYYIFAR